VQRQRPLSGICLLGASILAATVQGQPPSAGASLAEATARCQFTAGPRAGQIQDLAKMPGAVPGRIGGPCSDGASSTGIAVAPAAVACQYSSGPRAGEIQDLAAVPGSPPVAIGSDCSDGASSGIAVVSNASNSAPISWSGVSRGSGVTAGRATSTICQFMSGPKAHGWHDYAPLPPAAIGTSCQDGSNSAGVVVASGHGQQY
jgi:hypothetical protein